MNPKLPNFLSLKTLVANPVSPLNEGNVREAFDQYDSNARAAALRPLQNRAQEARTGSAQLKQRVPLTNFIMGNLA